MEYRQLGRSGLKVSALAFGTATFGGVGPLAKWGATETAQARRLLDICLEAGINLIDTANAYSRGRSEEILGEAMAGRRERLLVATKVRFRMGEGPNDLGLSRAHVVAQCEASLKRLGTDRIDLYLLHWPGRHPLRDTVAALCEAAIAPLALDEDALARRIVTAVSMLARADDERVIRLHPDDLDLVSQRLSAEWQVEPDPTLERGAVRVETATGGVEDGPGQWRRAIAEALHQC